NKHDIIPSGTIAQLGERAIEVRKVAGSIPARPIFLRVLILLQRSQRWKAPLNRPLHFLQVTTPDISAKADAEHSTAWAAMRMKRQYDRNHQPMQFQVGDKVYLKLGDGYNTPQNEVLPRRLAQRCVGRFTVLERVGRLAYRLNFPPDSRVHPVSDDYVESEGFDFGDIPRALQLWIQSQNGLKIHGVPVTNRETLESVFSLLDKGRVPHLDQFSAEYLARMIGIMYIRKITRTESGFKKVKAIPGEPGKLIRLKCKGCQRPVLDDAFPFFVADLPNCYLIEVVRSSQKGGNGCGQNGCKGKPGLVPANHGEQDHTRMETRAIAQTERRRANWKAPLCRTGKDLDGYAETVRVYCKGSSHASHYIPSGTIAQLGERAIEVRKVAGSIPARPILFALFVYLPAMYDFQSELNAKLIGSSNFSFSFPRRSLCSLYSGYAGMSTNTKRRIHVHTCAGILK
ncbi:hypothetical protein N7535_000138, partial [Penicillium sp. DV-2018c]